MAHQWPIMQSSVELQGSETKSDSDLLHAHLLWHYDDAAVTFHCSCQGQSNPYNNNRKKTCSTKYLSCIYLKSVCWHSGTQPGFPNKFAWQVDCKPKTVHPFSQVIGVNKILLIYLWLWMHLSFTNVHGLYWITAQDNMGRQGQLAKKTKLVHINGGSWNAVQQVLI